MWCCCIGTTSRSSTGQAKRSLRRTRAARRAANSDSDALTLPSSEDELDLSDLSDDDAPRRPRARPRRAAAARRARYADLEKSEEEDEDEGMLY